MLNFVGLFIFGNSLKVLFKQIVYSGGEYHEVLGLLKKKADQLLDLDLSFKIQSIMELGHMLQNAQIIQKLHAKRHQV